MKEEAVRARDQAKTACRDAQKDYEKRVASEAKSNPKAFFSYAKSKMKCKESISNLVTESGTASTDEEKADVLNCFFASVFTTERTDSFPNPPEYTISETISNLSVTEDDVRKELLKMDPSKAPGPDGIQPRLLSELAEELSEPLAIIFNASLSCGVVPVAWKKADITPIFKKGAKSDPSNYRPVSLTCVASKILEKFVRRAILQHLIKERVLSDAQHGFVPQKSCITNLLDTIDEWTDAIANNVAVDAIYTDFAKAFDTVPHKRLLMKLSCLGIDGNLLSWIESFLSNRSQRVRINNVRSSPKPVTSGIPQGTVFGPLLFVCFINDLPMSVQDSIVKMFADDTKLYRRISDPADCEDLQKDLDRLVSWSEEWQLSFNAKKCKVVHVGSAERPHFDYKMSAVILEESKGEKDLGVLVDDQLGFEDHIEQQVAKANRILGLIRRTYVHMDGSSMKLLFCALVRPHLEYGNVIWQPPVTERDKSRACKIESVLRRATRMVPEWRHLAYEERLAKLDLPSMWYRQQRADVIEVWKFKNEYYNMENPILHWSKDDRQGPRPGTRNAAHGLKKLTAPNNNSVRRQFFSYRAVNRWNSLSDEVRSAPTMNTFKNRLDRAWVDKRFRSPYGPWANYNLDS